ncbi:MAG: cardiolipin synthase [Rubricoccaceae bacterium]|nr:cardiolipin synthase [Rubricoccaceae bacterium]
MYDGGFFGWLLGLGIPLFYLLGAVSAVDAIMKTRTPQGATAWALSLVTVPFVALPLYWVFGRARFRDYVQAMEDFDDVLGVRFSDPDEGPLAPCLVEPEAAAPERERGELVALRALATLPFTAGNDGRLLVDGHATFDAILGAIAQAKDYVLAQFYIIHDDDIGRRFQEALCAAAGRGARVYLLYDEVGSYKLPETYKRGLREAGVHVSGFSGRRAWLGRFRINFRNHRKIVVVDGRRAFIGGHNVGDEYLSRDPDFGHWRDTHIALEGPVVQGVQYAFLKDWHYGRNRLPEVRWAPTPSPADRCALVLASGPADEIETCGLLFAHIAESAEQRVWIATPYFVPDGRVLGALQLAALRGVDVRILMPRKTDAWYFKYVPYAYFPDVAKAGVKVYLYEDGFMHQKVALVDDDYAAVSTANLDNRSFRLNFELTVLFNDAGFCGEVEAMLERDLAQSTQLTREDLTSRSFAFRFATQATRLLAPVL